MGVDETPAFFVTHCSLELVYPDTRIYRHDLAFHCFKATLGVKNTVQCKEGSALLTELVDPQAPIGSIGI